MERISNKITQVKVTTEDGNIVILEVQTQGAWNKNQNQKDEKVNTIINEIFCGDLKPTANDESVRIFRCALCPQSFSREALLIRHKTVHEKSREYQCEHCKKWFACRSSLNRHRRVHTGKNF